MSNASVLLNPMQPYVFIRKTHFYVINLHGDEDARANAECNPGTIRVENMRGQQVWPVAKSTRSAR